jgi:uncharacterized surface protein with fasciclin (FAS1) repeats
MQVILFADKFLNMSNIVDVVEADKNLATMMRSVMAVGLETELNKTGPFTLFAPTDLAFGKLPIGELTELMKPENKVKLTGILSYHIVQGRTDFKDFKDGQKLKTIDGKELDVKVTAGNVTINGAKVQKRDSGASNGVVHSMDTVIPAK